MRWIMLLSCCLYGFLASCCASAEQEIRIELGESHSERIGPPPTRPIPSVLRVGVGEFEDKTGIFQEVTESTTAVQTGAPTADIPMRRTSRTPVGEGMREQLLSTLIQSRQFRVFDLRRGEDDVDIKFEGAVTEFLANKNAIAGSAGWNEAQRIRRADPTVAAGTVISQIFTDTALGGFVESGAITIDFTVSNAKTGEYIDALTIRDKPTSVGGAFNRFVGRRGLDVGSQSQASVQERIRKCIESAVDQLASRAPSWYVEGEPMQDHASLKTESIEFSTLLPVDEGSTVADFVTFREDILRAIATEDDEYLLNHASENIQFSMRSDEGDDVNSNLTGRQQFKEILNSPRRELALAVLRDNTRLGGTWGDRRFHTYDKSFFCANYVDMCWPESRIPLTTPTIYGAITGTNVSVRSGPSSRLPVVATLSYEIVEVLENNVLILERGGVDSEEIGGEIHSWYPIRTASGISGYVYGRYITCPTYGVVTLVFRKIDKDWRIVYLHLDC